MAERDPIEETKTFVQQMTTYRIVEGPAEPDSPRGRLERYLAEHPDERVTPELVKAAREGKL
ncbi:hypothetical protein AB0D08_00520 [Kitasatospora sp. NPDC048540]|uniref:hypothetical protein n=1 Tax=Kitasatospora sp. NPDC048540 TaxID=3155634 RepID=UPI0033CD3CAE